MYHSAFPEAMKVTRSFYNILVFSLDIPQYIVIVSPHFHSKAGYVLFNIDNYYTFQIVSNMSPVSGTADVFSNPVFPVNVSK